MFCKKGVLKNFDKLTGRHLCQSLFFNKLQTSNLSEYHDNLNLTWVMQKQSPECVLKNFPNFTGKHLMLESLINKVVGFNKIRLQHRCFPVKFAKFLRAPILKNICKRLLLNFCIFKFRTFLVLVPGGETFSFDYIIYIKAGSIYYINFYETIQYLY